MLKVWRHDWRASNARLKLAKPAVFLGFAAACTASDEMTALTAAIVTDEATESDSDYELDGKRKLKQ
jgi:hypothetical protein